MGRLFNQFIPGRPIKRDILTNFWPLLIFLTVLAVGLAIRTERFHSIDEVAIYQTSANLVQHGELQIPQLGFALWGLRPGEAVVLLNSDGELYTKKSPAVIWALFPLLKIGQLWPKFSFTQSALLFGPLMLASTAALVLDTAHRLGYQRRTGIAAAFLFAIFSMALPYSQTIFGEVLAMFAFTLLVWGAAAFDLSSTKGALLAGVSLSIAIGCNVAFGIVVPVFFLILLSHHRQKAQKFKLPYGPTAALVIPLGLTLGLFAFYNVWRFGSVFESGYQLSSGQEGFTNPLWWGLAGLWISPARGFIFYNPLVFLGLLGWPEFHRSPHTRWLSWLFLGIVLGISSVFALWWQWWGGFGWGPRFLLPLVPIFIVLSLPFLEKWLLHPSPWALSNWRFIAAGLVIVLSGFVQAGGILVNFNEVESRLAGRYPGPGPSARPLLYHHDPELVFNWWESPIFWHWRLIDEGQIQWSENAVREDLSPLTQLLEEKWREGDTVLHLGSSEGQEIYELSDVFPVYGLPINISSSDQLANRLFANGHSAADRVWIVGTLPSGSQLNWYEAALWKNGWASLTSQQIGRWQINLFSPPLTDGGQTWRTAGVNFGPIHLERYRPSCHDGLLSIEFEWQMNEQTAVDWTTFVHLLQDGQLSQQQDRLPWNGYFPTTRWPVGEVVVDHFAFEGVQDCSQVEIGVGWYDWRDQSQLPAEENGDSLPDNRYLIGDFEK